MNIATQLNAVMDILWDVGQNPDDPVVIKALASYVKTHGRRNHENVFDVIDILWPNEVFAMMQREKYEHSEQDYIVDVQFSDTSQVLLICRNGIADGLGLIG